VCHFLQACHHLQYQTEEAPVSLLLPECLRSQMPSQFHSHSLQQTLEAWLCRLLQRGSHLLDNLQLHQLGHHPPLLLQCHQARQPDHHQPLQLDRHQARQLDRHQARQLDHHQELQLGCHQARRLDRHQLRQADQLQEHLELSHLLRLHLANLPQGRQERSLSRQPHLPFQHQEHLEFRYREHLVLSLSRQVQQQAHLVLSLLFQLQLQQEHLVRSLSRQLNLVSRPLVLPECSRSYQEHRHLEPRVLRQVLQVSCPFLEAMQHL